MLTTSLDHLVLTVTDIPATCRFYGRVLGLEAVTFGGGRTALLIGSQKINLHESGREIEPHAARPAPGSADLCFVAERPVADLLRHLESCGVEVELGPVERTGARGPMISLYFRDPDRNLVELGTYAERR